MRTLQSVFLETSFLEQKRLFSIWNDFLGVKFWTFLKWRNICTHINPIYTKPAPMESARIELSIGAGLVKFRAFSRMLWTKQKSFLIQFCCQKNHFVSKMSYTGQKRIWIWICSNHLGQIQKTRNVSKICP